MGKVVCFTTGGTIASEYVGETQGFLPTLTGEALLRSIPSMAHIVDVEVVELARASSHVFTPEQVFGWTHEVKPRLKEKDVVGAVITHGTDTLEESAYLFDLVLSQEKPIVFTGAMRAHGELGADGSRNLMDAVLTALAPEARDLGVLAVFNREIHTARGVTKADSEALNAFSSPASGCLGRVFTARRGDEVVIWSRPKDREFIPTQRLEARVAYIKALMGTDSSGLKLAVESGALGIVIEALPGGEISPYMVEGIDCALDKGVPVVVVTRAQGGRPADLWMEPGAGGWLDARGVLLADDISGPKARLKLMLALGLNDDVALRRLFR